MSRELLGEPSHVSAESGEVLLDGPGGVALAFTIDAAEETGRRMLDAAATARTQRPGETAPDA